MPEHDYLPRADVDFLLWHDGLLDSVRKHATTYGVTAPELAQLAAANQTLHAHIVDVAETAAKAAAAVASKDAFRQTVERECRALARRLKAHPAYTGAFGHSIGIASRQAVRDPATLQPELELTGSEGGEVRLAYTKTATDGINVYGRYGVAEPWTLLGRSTRSPYVDRRALRQPDQPETREYRAVHVLVDEEVGQASAIATITVRPR